MAKTKFQAKLKDAYYFPHFCNARHDRKIKRVRKELAVEGYGIYFMILEILREQADFRYPVEDIDLIADELQTSEQKVSAVIHNYDLFSFDDDKMFYSENLIMFLQPYLIKSQNAKKAAQIRWNKHNKKNGLLQENLPIILNEDANAMQMHSDSTTNADTNAMPEESIGDYKREEEIIKEKNTKKEIPTFSKFIPDKNSLSDQITAAIDYWNSFNKMPKCSYTIFTLPMVSDVTTKFDVFRDGEILGAIKNLSICFDKIDATYRPKVFHKFIINSLDHWLDSAEPLKQFEDVKTEPTYKTEQERYYHKGLELKKQQGDKWTVKDEEWLSIRKQEMKESLKNV